jgi:hypothetical protein
MVTMILHRANRSTDSTVALWLWRDLSTPSMLAGAACYNYSLGSSLMNIAPDVYRNGDYDDDRMNCGQPMVGEYGEKRFGDRWRILQRRNRRTDESSGGDNSQSFPRK